MPVPQRIAISGSSGLIGTALVGHLKSEGHTVQRLVRRAPVASDEVQWDPQTGYVDLTALEGINAVIHLAGVGVGDKRWSKKYKSEILNSRLMGTTAIAKAVAELKPQVFISASAYISKEKQNFHQVTNVYFEAKIAPTKKAVVVLNASTDKKWVNNLTVMSNISNKYAPTGKVLITVSYNGIPTIDDATLSENMKAELKKGYGKQVDDWKMIKTYRINYALPNQEKVSNEVSNSELKINENLFICGDHLMNGSINAAMKSGRMVAELIEKNATNN